MGVLDVATLIDPRTIPRARRLRQAMTEGERRLWNELRMFRRWFGIHVRKQAPVGPYVADFAVHERRLTIEVDGEHHFTPVQQGSDRERDEWLAAQGYRVLRFNIGELSDSLAGCVDEIMRALGLNGQAQRSPTPNPSPQVGGEQGCTT